MTDLELKVQVRRALDASMPPLPEDPLLTDKVLGRDAEARQSRRRQVMGLRVAVALAVIVLIVCGGLLVQNLSHDFLDGWQSDDGKEYFIQGVSVTPAGGGTAEAENAHTENIFVITEDWNEAVSSYGRTPHVPSWLPEGWQVDHYEVSVFESFSRFIVGYRKSAPTEDDPEQENYLILDAISFVDVNDLHGSIEQSAPGTNMQLANGLTVYVSKNLDKATSIWMDDGTSYTLTGVVTEDELLRIIRSIYGLD